jgi:putative membrane protein
LGKNEPLVFLIVGFMALGFSGINPHDRFTWILEIAPILIAVPILLATYFRFRLTPLAYRLIFIHALILMIGGHYTYALVPAGFWVQDLLNLSRNHYDRLGHLAQGFIPAILVREILIRQSPLKPGKWLFFLVTCVCLAFSACYEFIEWWTSLAEGQAADAFLGTQGDVWDTQWDMLMAFVGALLAQIFLARMHDRELVKIP